MVEVQKLEVFCVVVLARATLCGDRRGRGAKTQGFLAFFVFIIFAGIGMVEVQKLRGVFLRLLLFELVFGSCLAVRAPAPGPAGRGFDSPWSAGGLRKLHGATCIEQLPRKLRRPFFARRNLRKATCRRAGPLERAVARVCREAGG